MTPLLQIYAENSKAHVAFDKRFQKQGVEQLIQKQAVSSLEIHFEQSLSAIWLFVRP